jgi:hypothetical protein
MRYDAPAPQAAEIGQAAPAFGRVSLQEFGHAAEEALNPGRGTMPPMNTEPQPCVEA